MRTTRSTCVVVAVAAATLLVSQSASADRIVYRDRDSFHGALDSDPSFEKTVEGWDAYPAGTVLRDGSTMNGITYYVSAGDALVVDGGISLSPPNNLFETECGTVQACTFRPLVDTFTFTFSEPIVAFGITFSSTFATNDGDYILTTDRGEVVYSFFDPLTPGFPLGQFAGFISNEPFTSVTVSSTVNALYGMDDLVFARSASTPSLVTRRDNSWETTASPAQVAGALSTAAWPRVAVGLDVNESRDEANLYIESGHLARIGQVTIRCGVAGAVGPIVWQRGAASMAPMQPIRSGEIIATDPQSTCGTRINNIASLEAAARDRRLYVEMDRVGIAVRGQLGPKSTSFDQGVALVGRQVVGVNDAPFSSGAHAVLSPVDTNAHSSGPLAALMYEIPHASRLFRSAALRCGRAGENGEIVATLPSERGTLTSSDVIPTNPDGKCGLAVTHIASLHEAWLRGNLYIEALPLDAHNPVLRGQVSPTARDAFDNSWEAIASTAQIPGASDATAGRMISAGLGVNTAKEEARLYVAVAEIPRITTLALRCGSAGTAGPVVWQIAAAALGEPGTVISNGNTAVAAEPFHNGDIIPADAQGACGVAINNVASLEAAARERRLYVEVESGGVVLRGQLWPKRLSAELSALLSDQQVVGAGAPLWTRTRVTLKLSQQGYAPGSLTELPFEVETADPGVPVSLFCGRAGETGELVGSLNSRRGTLTNANLIPTQAAGPCGMGVTTIASLLEAALRGNLYAETTLGGLPLRGQFPAQ